jgi:hypothetical protein
MVGNYKKALAARKLLNVKGYAQRQTPVWEDYTTSGTNRAIVETKIVFKP